MSYIPQNIGNTVFLAHCNVIAIALKDLGICYFWTDMFQESISCLQESIYLYHSLHCEVEINLAEGTWTVLPMSTFYSPALVHYAALLCLGMNYVKACDFANAVELITKSLFGLVEKSADYILGIVYICFKYCICIITYSVVLSLQCRSSITHAGNLFVRSNTFQ